MLRFLIIIAALSLGSLAHADGKISTVAGASTQDGVPATSTLVNYPAGIAADGVGNVYISDTGNHRIRRVDAGTGIITTIAGTGVQGYLGDDAAATDAWLNSPGGLSYVNNGTTALLYVADTGNQMIRRINLSTGVITKVAGSGISTFSGDDGLAIYASLKNPKGLYADTSGNIYIADTGNNRIRFVSGASGNITTVAGSGGAGYGGDGYQGLSANVQLNAPETCLVGPGGNLYIADTNNYRVRLLNLSTKVISTAAGNGSYGYTPSGTAAGSSAFTYIHGLYADPTYVFIADSLNHRIRYLYGGNVYDWFGTGVAGYSGDGGYYGSATINNPGAMTVDSNYNNVFVDYSNNCVRKVDLGTSLINTIAGSGIQDGVPATNVVLKNPGKVIPGSSSSQILVAESGANKVRSLDLGSNIIGTFAGTGSPAYAGDGGPASAASFFGVKDIVRDSLGNVYIADNYSYQYTYIYFGGCGFFGICFAQATAGQSRIRMVDSFGNITTVAGTAQLNNTGNGGQAGLAGLGLIEGLAQYGSSLYLADSYFHVLRKINQSTGVITALGGVSGTAGYGGDGGLVSGASFSSPHGLATDSSGNLYIADTDNNCVRRVAASNLSITTICGLGPTHAGYSGDGGQANLAALFSPSGVFVDSGNNLYIADSGNHRIRRIDAVSNSITTVVGNGFQGFSGDGGPALSATLNRPGGVYVQPQGSIYVADSNNDRVRKVSFAVQPTPTPLVSGAGKVAAYPSPASDRICFSYTAAAPGKAVIEVYNVALQLVAKFEDSVPAGTATTCGSISGLASGVYLYRLSVAGSGFTPNKFKVAH